MESIDRQPLVGMSDKMKKLAESGRFTAFITIVILLAAVLVGMETYPSLMAEYGTLFHILDQVIIWIFVVEIIIRMGAHGWRPWRYFKDPWNVFDFIIVAVAFMPFGSSSIAVVRLARLLRILKLVRALPQLQVLVSALIRSIPSLGYVSILLFLLFYIYAVAAVIFFGQNDPIHFNSLPIALISLFRAVTLEDWTDLMYIQMYGCNGYGYDGNEALCVNPSAHPVGAALFFISFILIGTMIILNLFIGVIMKGMDEARAEQSDERYRETTGDLPTSQENILLLKQKMAEISDLLVVLERSAARATAVDKKGRSVSERK